MPGGFIGVDVFFVISGYLITGILLERRARGMSVPAFVLDFYKHRVRRIFPALIVVLVACAVYGWFRLFPAEYEGLTKYIAGGAAFIENLVAWAEAGYFDQSADLKPLLHLWSLAIEEQFYIVWPLLILVVGKLTRGKYFTLLFGTLAVASFVYCVWVTSADPTAAYYSPLSRGWELAVGGILAALKHRGFAARPSIAASAVSAAALAVIPIGALFFVSATGFPGWQALVPVVATAAIIWFGAGSWVNRTVLSWRPIVHLGLISYPLYLWHWVVLSFIRIQNSQPSGLVLLGALAGSVLLAAATYHFVERPLKRFPIGRVSIVALGAMVVVFAFGLTATTLKLSGVVLTPNQVALSQSYDPRPDYRFGTCFLDSATQTSAEFAAKCSGSPTSAEPVLLLWGDSLAAQLYPGFAAKSDLGYTIAQRTATSCPAATDDPYSDRGNCNELNAATRKFIEDTRPAAVVIDGRWPEDLAQRTAQLESITQFLRSNGVSTVLLVGPAPDWEPDLRSILLRATLPNDDSLPEYLTPPAFTWAGTVARDEELAATADKLGIAYISIVDELCRVDECRIRVSDDIPAGLVTSDHDHLTAQASEFVLRNYRVPAP